MCTICMVLYIVIHRFFKDFIYLFLEKGEEREKERERDFSVRGKIARLPLQLGTWSATQACALTRNQTRDVLVCRRHPTQ